MKNYSNLLILFYFILFNYQAEASDVDLNFEKKSIKQHCNHSLNKDDEKLFNNNWETLSSNKFIDEFFHTSKVKMSVRKIIRGEKKYGLRYVFFNKFGKEKLMVNVNTECKIKLSRLIVRNKKGKINFIANLSPDLNSFINQEFLNPPVPKVTPHKGTKLALIDTGVNYTLQSITTKLSRENHSTLSGYDFEDDDNLPFDVDTSRSEFFPFHHGTAVASIIIREAPEAEIVVYRFPRSNMCKFKDLIDHLASKDIKIVSLPMGSKNESDWVCFKESLMKNKDILFFVSAGNEGLNIDDNKIYPASFELENIIVVTSSDIFGNLARGSNYGKTSVDFLVPGEQISVIDHRGVKTKASGSSFAVPRLVSLAARYITKHNNAKVVDIKNMLIARAVSKSEWVKYGWIPDPLDNYLFD